MKNNQDIENIRQEDVDSEMEANVNDSTENIVSSDSNTENGVEEANTPENEIENIKEELAKEKKEYLFLMADFDNFRKRTLKEKAEIIKNGGENVLKGLLPILDDFERGIKAINNSESVDSVKEGMELIYNKFKKYLEQNGVKEIDTNDIEFDTSRHEAISVVPVQDETLKGKILDTVQKGYTINDKVLRHAKVVVGQ